MDYEQIMTELREIAARLTRVESRIVQLMIHLNLDPYGKTYARMPDKEER